MPIVVWLTQQLCSNSSPTRANLPTNIARSGYLVSFPQFGSSVRAPSMAAPRPSPRGFAGLHFHEFLCLQLFSAICGYKRPMGNDIAREKVKQVFDCSTICVHCSTMHCIFTNRRHWLKDYTHFTRDNKRSEMHVLEQNQGQKDPKEKMRLFQVDSLLTSSNPHGYITKLQIEYK